MQGLKKLLFNRYSILVLLVSMILIAGCNMDLENEVWLNKDGSGKAAIRAFVEYSKADAGEEDMDLAKRKVLQNYVKLIEKTPGAILTSDKSTDLSDAEYISASFQVEFRFDNLATLNKILAVDKQNAFEIVKKANTELKINSSRLHMIDAGTLTDATPDYNMFEINYSLIMHTPSKIVSSDASSGKRSGDMTMTWNFRIDDDWFKEPAKQIIVKY